VLGSGKEFKAHIINFHADYRFFDVQMRSKIKIISEKESHWLSCENKGIKKSGICPCSIQFNSHK